MRVLVAEDDGGLRDVLVRGLREAGYVVDAAVDGDDALAYLAVNEYGVCVLDWRLPGPSGVDVVAWARARNISTPILMLTARDAPGDRVEALDSGADDYLVKPFDYGELLARLRALLRRPAGDRSPQLVCGSLVVDPTTREVRAAGVAVELTAREFAVVEILARRAPAVVLRRSIALNAWPEESDAVGSNTIDVHIARIRGKIAHCDARIDTVRGVGYRLVGP
ncbi:MAG TPA: response regulator transcription factor [Acidimicrobiales bacterium]|nr:response regulator transcription factor [Acidimicrobiales bacterium]